MTSAPAAAPYLAVILRDDVDDERSKVAELRSDSRVAVTDLCSAMGAELRGIRPSPTEVELAEPARWCYYPWRPALVHLLGPSGFRRLRLDRNRNKITASEQDQLARLKVGVVGLSVGHAIAHTLALEGLCAQLRLADFDSIELSNLNRVPATILDIGLNKAVVAARRIAELDPYLNVEVFAEGVTERTLGPFVDGLDLVIEECDSLDVKVRLRQEARARGIPVLMQTSDRGLFDVERFDLEPHRQLFHGLLGSVQPESLAHLTNRDKAPHVMRILQASELSARMAASMIEIDRAVSTWPQLGGDVQLGAATVAAAVRRWGRGEHLPSGRIRVDLDVQLDALDHRLVDEQPAGDHRTNVDLTMDIPAAPLEAVVHAIRLGPSGGNSQPWSITSHPDRVDIHLAADRTSAMDIEFRGSYVAIGAAGFNARVAAAQHSVLGRLTEFPNTELAPGAGSDVVLSLSIGEAADTQLAALYPAMIKRISNRNAGVRLPLAEAVAAELARAAEAEGAQLILVTDEDQLAQLADVLAESDRLRYLTPLLHEQMMSELRWPGSDRMDVGIDVRTLGLDPVDLAKLRVAGRADVMALLASWRGGTALGDDTRDRVAACSAVAVITVGQPSARDYLNGGAAAERVWVHATNNDLGVQPISPIFLYARNDQERNELSPGFSSELTAAQEQFEGILQVAADRVPALVLRLCHHPGSVVRSARLPLTEILRTVVPRETAWQ